MDVEVLTIYHVESHLQSCDASMLLDNDPARGIQSEKYSGRNFGMKNFKYINTIKEALENECPSTISCTDIIALSARDAVQLHGFQTPHCNDEMSTRAILEVEEMTILPVSEEKKVIHWEDNNIGGGILETVRTEVRQAISDMHKDLKDVMLRSDSEVSSCSMLLDVTELPNSITVDLVRSFREEFLRELEEILGRPAENCLGSLRKW